MFLVSSFTFKCNLIQYFIDWIITLFFAVALFSFYVYNSLWNKTKKYLLFLIYGWLYILAKGITKTFMMF